MRVGYAKLGRSLQLDLSRGDMAGNAEAVNVLVRLARRNPDVDWYIVGKNNGGGATPYPSNVYNLWPEGVPKAPWLHADGLYRCSFCKTAVATPTQWALDCCDRAREVVSIEDFVKAQMMRLDALVMHVGQHGVVHAPIPTATTRWQDQDLATPYAWARNYGYYLIDGFNLFCNAHDGGKGRVAWLAADPRNFFKARDIAWPTGATADEPVLAQYAYSRDGKHERFGDTRTPHELGFKAEPIVNGEKWKVLHHYRHSGLDMAMLPDDWRTWGATDFDDRVPVAVATTASYLPDRRMRRSALVQDWVFDNFPDARVYGKWSDKSLADVTPPSTVIVNNPLDFPQLLASSRTTISLPPTGTVNNGMYWAVAKPWQCFAANTACFFIPPVDAQGWVVPNVVQWEGTKRVADGLWSVRDDWTDDELNLARWLRCTTPADYAARVRAVCESRDTYAWIARTQRSLLERRWNEQLLENLIEQRIGIRNG